MFNVVSNGPADFAIPSKLFLLNKHVMSVQNSFSRLLNADFRRSSRMQGIYKYSIDFEPSLYGAPSVNKLFSLFSPTIFVIY